MKTFGFFEDQLMVMHVNLANLHHGQMNYLSVKKFSYKNFSFNGADTDQQINILYRNIDKALPNVILWANKFNTKNIFGKTE